MERDITAVGLEAGILTDLLLTAGGHCSDGGSTLLEEPAGVYGISIKIQEMEARLLLAIAARIRKRLDKISSPPDNGIDGDFERLTITRDYRILLTDRGGEELKLGPLPRSLYILFLKHPEGIRFKEMYKYRDELTDIYLRISPRTDLNAVRDSIERLITPQTNAMSVNCSRLATALSGYFNGNLLPSYLISGTNGQARSITLQRRYIIWE